MDEALLKAAFDVEVLGFQLRIRMVVGPELAVVFGPSGAGKSLALRALAGLIRPARGAISLRGQTLFDSERGIDLPPQIRRIGYVPQNYALFPHKTIAENIAYALNDIPRQERNRRVEELLGLMRLADQAERLPTEVSGGQQQRTALARALARHPNLLLMDEPFAALDEGLRTHLRDELRRVQQSYCIPVLLVTHNLSEAYSLADRLVVVSEGEVIQSGPRDDVFRQPRNPQVARLMGMVNILDAQVVERRPEMTVVDWNGIPLKISPEVMAEPGARLTLGVRPEEIMIVRQHRALPADLEENLLEAAILEDKPMGFDHLVTLAVESSVPLESRTLHMRIPHPIYLKLELALGETRMLSIKPTSFHVFPAGNPS